MECFVGSYRPAVGSAASSFVSTSAICRTVRRTRRTSAASVAVRRRLTVKAQEEGDETVVEERRLVELTPEEQAEKDKIMADLQEEMMSKVILPNNRNLGATRDVDGKSNIWAVEPKVTLDESNNSQLKKIIPLAVVALILLGIAILPRLPLLSPDVY